VQFAPDGQSIAPYSPGVVSGGLAVGGQGIDPALTSSLAASVQRATATVIGHYDLTSHIKLSGEFTYGHTVSNDPYSTQSVLRFVGGSKGEGQAGFQFTNNNPYLSAADIASLSALSPTFAGGGILYDSRFLDILPSRAQTATTDTGRAVVSLDGDFHAIKRDFTWEVSFSHALSDGSNSQWQANNSHLVNALNAVRNGSGQIVCGINAVTITDPACAPIDPFGNVGISPAAQSYVSVKIGGQYFNIQNDFLSTFGGDLFTLPGGKVKFNAAYEHRYESANFKPSAAQQNGLIFGGEISLPEKGDYRTDELSGEMLIPVVGGDFTLPFVKALEFDGSYRYVINTLAGHESVWDIGGRWEVGYGVTFRASKSRNFRAPTLDQLVAPQTTSVNFLGFDPCNANQIKSTPNPAVTLANCQAEFAQHQTGVLGQGNWGPLSTFNDQATNTSIVAVTSGGNPNLKNEVSDTLTYGFVYQPTYVPGLQVSVDRIEVTLTQALTCSASPPSLAAAMRCHRSRRTSATPSPAIRTTEMW
jgi:outer membrane receptor protein involved in Fe transport